jgi:hypothetical protein
MHTSRHANQNFNHNDTFINRVYPADYILWITWSCYTPFVFKYGVLLTFILQLEILQLLSIYYSRAIISITPLVL